jgi:hypothetical protein
MYPEVIKEVYSKLSFDFQKTCNEILGFELFDQPNLDEENFS